MINCLGPEHNTVSQVRLEPVALRPYATLTNLSKIYLVMCKIFTDVGSLKKLYHVCPPVRKIIHELKLVDYLHGQADKPWYN